LRGFSILAPGAPTVTETPLGPGGVRMHNFQFSADPTLVVSVLDLPEQPVNIDRDLARVKAGLLQRLSARSPTILSEQRVALQGHPGIEVVIRMTGEAGTAIGVFRTYLAGRRMYSLTAIRFIDAPDHSKAFLDSLRIAQGAGPPKLYEARMQEPSFLGGYVAGRVLGAGLLAWILLKLWSRGHPDRRITPAKIITLGAVILLLLLGMPRH
jgi:hypothetical protein